jgi:hypothetical protein
MESVTPFQTSGGVTDSVTPFSLACVDVDTVRDTIVNGRVVVHIQVTPLFAWWVVVSTLNICRRTSKLDM